MFLAAVLLADTSLCPGADAQETGTAQRFDVRNDIALEWAARLEKWDTQKLELVYQPQLETQLPQDVDLTAIGRIRSELSNELQPHGPSLDAMSCLSRQAFLGDRVEIELRELYLTTTVRDVYLSIGKQQIVWGNADRFRVLDVVNPLDYREFILDEFEDSRIPLWSGDVQIPINNLALEIVWIPDQTYNVFPEAESVFENTANVPRPPPFFRVDRQPPEKPGRVLADSDVGIRLSGFRNGWDFGFNYLYHYDDTPVLYRSLGLTIRGPTVTIEPAYERSHLIGGSFSNSFGNLTFRGELAFSFDKYYPSARFLDPDGIIKTNEFAYVLGLDWFGFRETFLSFQLFQNAVTTNDSMLFRDRLETYATFDVRREFLNDTLIAETFCVHDFNNNGGLVSPRISYALRDGLRLDAGVDIFYGPMNTLFGQFNHEDRLFVGIELSF